MEVKIMRKKVIVGFFVILVCVLGGFFFWKFYHTDQELSDALRFKEDYEQLNGTIRQSDGALYNSVEIPSDNPIRYVSALEAVDIIQNQTGVIYLGANWCPWCRNAVEVLIEAAKDKGLDTIYYVDMDKLRNVWEVQDGKLVKTQQEQEGYYDLLKALDPILGEKTYSLTSKGKTYDTKEKRIYMPLVVFLKDGKILDTHSSTVSLNSDQTKYSKLTEEQHDELKKIYESLIEKIQ